ncbi:MAG: arginine--tRNA ligase [Clostridiales bacterium]|nr:arginine--tRNA ligase [Clostridiales bacterium]
MDFKNEAASRLHALLSKDGAELSEILSAIETPPDPAMGDYAYPCFKLAKIMRKSPAAIAEEISRKIPPDAVISKVAAAGAYVNFFVDKTLFARAVLSRVAEEGADYGKSAVNAGQTIVMDYSSPNIAKPFHVGHIPTTVVGAALYKIFRFTGADVIGINHLGDWGTQFGKLIVAYKRYGSRAEVDEGGVTELMRLYVKFHEEAEKEPAMDEEARAWLVKMQNGDEEALSLWRWFNDISLAEYKEKTYKRLGIDFDYYTGESFYNDKMADVADELSEKGLLKESGGARIVDLEEFNMPPCLILRSDGGTLYPTRDIAAAFYRKKTYNFDKCLYLTCMDQSLHFAQWFKVVGLMGYDWAKDLEHVPLGMIAFEEGKLSTRKGRVILLNDLLDDAVRKTLGIINEKNPGLINKEETAEAVGVGAVVFANLYNGRARDVCFSWERALSFEGESGPYVQYTHARARSILRKSGAAAGDIDYSRLSDAESIEVISCLAEFPERIEAAAREREPFLVSRHLVNLCQSFNKFYNKHIVLTEEAEIRKARTALVGAVSVVLKTGLTLLGIKAPEEM